MALGGSNSDDLYIPWDCELYKRINSESLIC